MAELFRDPVIPGGEETVYQVRVGGAAERYDLVSRVDHDGGSRYLNLITATLGDLELEVRQAFAREGGRLASESYQAEARHNGTVVTREEGYFQGTEHLQFGGAVKPFPTDIVPLLGCLIGLRGLEFERGFKRNVELWLAFSVFWPLEVKVEKREVAKVPAGDLDAWRVRVRPSFAQISGLLDKVIGGLLPPFVLHFAAEAPHRMLRFSFPTGPLPWNPKGLIEATKID